MKYSILLKISVDLILGRIRFVAYITWKSVNKLGLYGALETNRRTDSIQFIKDENAFFLTKMIKLLIIIDAKKMKSEVPFKWVYFLTFKVFRKQILVYSIRYHRTDQSVWSSSEGRSAKAGISSSDWMLSDWGLSAPKEPSGGFWACLELLETWLFDFIRINFDLFVCRFLCAMRTLFSTLDQKLWPATFYHLEVLQFLAAFVNSTYLIHKIS